MSAENYQSTIFFHSDSLATVRPFFFLKLGQFDVLSTARDCSYLSKARYYFPVNVASVYSQNSSLSLAEKNGSGTAQSGSLPSSLLQ